jgi:uncharacterized protein YuzE
MGLFDYLNKLLSGKAAKPAREVQTLQIRCNRCGELVTAEVNLNSDLSLEYNENGNVVGYYCRKVVMGKARCFQKIEVVMRYSPKKHLQDQEVIGGTLVEGK